jgi:hypothetical protein
MSVQNFDCCILRVEVKHVFLSHTCLYTRFIKQTKCTFFKNQIRTKQFVVASNFCTCIQEVSDLAVVLDTGYPEVFRGFPQYVEENSL